MQFSCLISDTSYEFYVFFSVCSHSNNVVYDPLSVLGLLWHSADWAVHCDKFAQLPQQQGHRNLQPVSYLGPGKVKQCDNAMSICTFLSVFFRQSSIPCTS